MLCIVSLNVKGIFVYFFFNITGSAATKAKQTQQGIPLEDISDDKEDPYMMRKKIKKRIVLISKNMKVPTKLIYTKIIWFLLQQDIQRKPQARVPHQENLLLQR
jgi:hypothetical protein